VLPIALSRFATAKSSIQPQTGASMNNIARRWAIGATLLAATMAASPAENQPASPDVRPVSTRVSDKVSFSVNITPASPVPPNVTCTWTANVSEGTSPYHYAWAVNNSPVGYDSQYLSYTNNGGAFRIQVFVTDATSAQTNDSKIMTISSGGSCPT